MDAFDWVLIIGLSLACLLGWGGIIAQVMMHRERMRMISEKHNAYKRQVKPDVEYKIRTLSGDMDYELGGDIDWSEEVK
jgi:hypothetical protein